MLEGAVRSSDVVSVIPVGDDAPGMGHAPEPVQVQALVAELANEALNVGILRGLAGLDKVEVASCVYMRVISDHPSGHSMPVMRYRPSR
jgi:hypothetical protein